MKKKLKIAEPCHENWNEMTTIEQGKHCEICSKKVIDFTTHSRTEIIDFLGKTEGQTCGRFKSNQIDVYGDKTTPVKKSIIPFYKVAAASIITFFGLGTNNLIAQDEGIYMLGDVDFHEYEETITNNQKVQLKGVISSLHNAAIEKAKVSIYSGGKLISSALTKNDGSYLFDIQKGALVNNRYTIKVFAENFNSKTFENLEATKTEISMNISMEYEMMIMGQIMVEPENEKVPEIPIIEENENNSEIKPSVENKHIKGKVCIIDIIEPKNKEEAIALGMVEVIPSALNVEEEVKTATPENEILQPTTPSTKEKDELVITKKRRDYEIIIYPNPSQSQVFVRTNKREKYEYNVTDMNGKLVFSGNKNGSSFELNFAGKPNGTYLISIYNQGVLLETKRVVILH